MKLYKSKSKNILHFLYRMIKPIFDPIKFVFGIEGYFWFFRDCFLYKTKDKKAKIFSFNLFPMLHEKVPFTLFDAHYFYQQLWVFEHVLKSRPEEHIDVGSTYQMSGYLSKVTKTKFIDLRPIDTKINNLVILRGDVLNLPYNDNSIKSLSCLHVVEHIGLGRYGRPIDPEGSVKACKELARVLAPGGRLYLSVPIGIDRLCFNAHRVHSSETILRYFSSLQLVEFSVVDDNGDFIQNCDWKDYNHLNYGCGMFLFIKE